MGDILNQSEIDSLIEALNNDMLLEWIELHKECEERKHLENNKIYVLQDYDLFYCTYKLENLTANHSVLRRYAYKDRQSFRKFKYFMVIEDYKNIGVNMVSVVGIEANTLNIPNYNYIYLIEHEPIFLVDASSLYYFCDVPIQNKIEQN